MDVLSVRWTPACKLLKTKGVTVTWRGWEAPGPVLPDNVTRSCLPFIGFIDESTGAGYATGYLQIVDGTHWRTRVHGRGNCNYPVIRSDPECFGPICPGRKTVRA